MEGAQDRLPQDADSQVRQFLRDAELETLVQPACALVRLVDAKLHDVDSSAGFVLEIVEHPRSDASCAESRLQRTMPTESNISRNLFHVIP